MFLKDKNKTFKIKIITRNLKYYQAKNYDCKLYDIIDVNIKDLPDNSSEIVKVLCDYCLKDKKETIIEIRYSKYLRNLKNKELDCCKKCRYSKTKETNIKKYGVENPGQMEEVKKKKKKTCLNKYGVEHTLQVKEIREQAKVTNLEKYGTEYPMQSEIVKEKIKTTNLERYDSEHYLSSNIGRETIKNSNLEKYGVENVFQVEEIKDKIKETNLLNLGVEYPSQSQKVRNKIKKTNLERYGVENVSQVPEIRDKQIRTWVKNRSKNGTFTTSTQQTYLHKLLGGKLNYPLDKCGLDIAFPEEMIYIEYDGSGHDASVTAYGGSREKFDRNEINRQYFLKNQGWKIIRIISKKDYLPSDEIIIKLIKEAKEYLNTGHSWYRIDIDNSLIQCSQFDKKINLGDLRKIKK